MKDKIVCLVGASGSGKTTIAKELEKLGYNIIQSYTTREPREENEWGHNFIGDWTKNMGFMISPDGHKTISHKDMIAFKEVYEGLYYFATKEQYQNKGISIYTVCPDGARQVKENVKDADVIVIYLEAYILKRIRRMTEDGRGNEHIKNRIARDKEIFRVCKCDYVLDAGRDKEKVLEDIIEIIKGDEK